MYRQQTVSSQVKSPVQGGGAVCKKTKAPKSDILLAPPKDLEVVNKKVIAIKGSKNTLEITFKAGTVDDVVNHYSTLEMASAGLFQFNK